jgi:hypothetical protein
MAKLLSHMLHREYAGEQLANTLLNWLNSRKRTVDHQRIVRLLMNLAVLRRAFGEDETARIWNAGNSKLRGLTWSVRGSSAMMGREFNRALRGARRELSRHRMWPDIYDITDRANSRARTKVDFIWNAGNSAASEAVLQIVLLGQEGLLWRVRQCLACERWFYARFSHQHYCGTRCQQGHYKRSPEWREHRRKYMQKYRRLTS